MRAIPLAVCVVVLAVSSPVAAQSLPAGKYECFLQPVGTMRIDPLGEMMVEEGSFSVPGVEGDEPEFYTYLLNPDNTVNLPVEWIAGVEGAKEIVDAVYYPDFETITSTILMEDGDQMSLTCNHYPE
jgi:hypothetical protein